MNGRITWSKEKGVQVVIDGVPMDMDDLARILATHEGWEFSLSIIDPLE